MHLCAVRVVAPDTKPGIPRGHAGSAGASLVASSTMYSNMRTTRTTLVSSLVWCCSAHCTQKDRDMHTISRPHGSQGTACLIHLISQGRRTCQIMAMAILATIHTTGFTSNLVSMASWARGGRMYCQMGITTHQTWRSPRRTVSQATVQRLHNLRFHRPARKYSQKMLTLTRHRDMTSRARQKQTRGSHSKSTPTRRSRRCHSRRHRYGRR